MTPEHISAMREFYQRLEREIAGLGGTCHACGGCCRFDEAEHLLYASTLERDYLKTVSPPPPLPGAPALRELVASGLRCPYQVENRCEARDGRVLGCRLHFCADGEAVADRAERWHRQLAELHDRLGVTWGYSRLLPL